MEAELLEASRRYAQKDFLGTLEALGNIDATDKNHLDLAYYLGLAHSRLGHWDEALLYLEQVVTGSDEILRVFQCRLALSLVYSITGRSRLAEYELGRLIAAGFESVQVLASMGFASWAQGRQDDAIKWYTKALSLEPENANALNGLGYILASTGKDIALAVSYCRKAVALAPDNAAYLDSLGWAYFHLGYIAEARSFVTKAAALSPKIDEILEHAKTLASIAERESV